MKHLLPALLLLVTAAIAAPPTDFTVKSATDKNTFSLKDDAGAVVWADTVLFDDDGNEIRSFSRSLALSAGVYDLNATLTASSSFDNNFGSAGRAVGAFTITAVPEADTVMMMFGGLVAMAFVARRRRVSDIGRRVSV